MPPGIGVGTGFVIDSYGNTSRQIDVLLYEKELCPVYKLNADVDYFPCEGVVAIGEVKSQISSAEIDDIFEKTASVRKLRRYAIAEKSLLGNYETVPFRSFGSRTAMKGTPEESFDQHTKLSDRIYGFGIGREFDISPKSALNRFARRAADWGDVNTPDIVLTAKGNTILPWSVEPIDKDKRLGSAKSVVDAKGFAMLDLEKDTLETLIDRLYDFLSSGRTVGIRAYNEYVKSSSDAGYRFMGYQDKMNGMG